MFTSLVGRDAPKEYLKGILPSNPARSTNLPQVMQGLWIRQRETVLVTIHHLLTQVAAEAHIHDVLLQKL
jgi:hypothetical protein